MTVKFLQPRNHNLLATDSFWHACILPVSAKFRPYYSVAWLTRDFLVVNHQQMFRGQIASRFTEVSIVRLTK